MWISTTFLERDGHLHCRTHGEKKVWATVFFFLNAIMHWKVIHVNFFCFFCHISRTTGFFLLPWQRDETTSPLYILENQFKKVSRESQTAKGKDCHVPFFCPHFYHAFRLLLSIYNVRVSVFTFLEEGPRILFS